MSSEWKNYEIGELCSVTSSKRIFAHDYVECGVPFYASKDVIDKSLGLFKGSEIYISHKRFSDIADKFGYPSKGDLLLSSVGNRAGIAYVVGDEGEFYFKDGNITWFKNFKSLNSTFLCYWLKSEVGKSALQSIMIGSAQKALTISGLLKLKIKIPSLREQCRIVEILSALDDRITLLRETNATLEAIAQALFKSWFVDFDPVRAKAEGRQPEGMDATAAALFPDSFEESELGLVPKEWRTSRLGDVCDYLNRGISPKYLEVGGVVVINQKCIRSFSIDLTKARRHDPLQRRIDGRRLAVGDVLVNSTGVGTLGRVAQVLALSETAIVDSHVTVVRAGPCLSWTYLGLWMMRQQTQIEAMGEGSTGQTELPRSKLAELRLTAPPTSVLSVFDEITLPIKERIALNENRVQVITQLRDTLLPRLISGQLRLPDAESLLEKAL
jgi:type I restriction enzyme S subunit